MNAERERARRSGEVPDFAPPLRRWGGVARSSIDDRLPNRRPVSAPSRGNHQGLRGRRHLRRRVGARNAPPATASGHIEVLVTRSARRRRPTVTGATSARKPRCRRAACWWPPVPVRTRPMPSKHKGHLSRSADSTRPSRRDGATPSGADRGPLQESGVRRLYLRMRTTAGSSCSSVTRIPTSTATWSGAVASGSRRVYPKIVEASGHERSTTSDTPLLACFHARMSDPFRAEVVAVTRLAYDVIELTVRADGRAPLPARPVLPLADFRIVRGRCSRARACTPNRWRWPARAWDAERGTVSTIGFERGASSRLVATLKPGEPVLLMGPTGVGIQCRPCRRHHPAHRRPAGRRHSARDRRPAWRAAEQARALLSSRSRARTRCFFARCRRSRRRQHYSASAVTEPFQPRRPATASSAARSPLF